MGIFSSRLLRRLAGEKAVEKAGVVGLGAEKSPAGAAEETEWVVCWLEKCIVYLNFHIFPRSREDA
jgi:hypothetical protein